MNAPRSARARRMGILLPSLDGGGAERVAQEWRSELERRGHDVFVYRYAPPEPSATTAGVDRQFAHASRFARTALLPLWIRRQASRDRLDVLIGVMTFANMTAILALRTIAPTTTHVVLTEHSLTTAALRRQGLPGLAKRLVARLLYPRASAAIAVSHAVAADLSARYAVPRSRLAVIPNPVLTRASIRSRREEARHPGSRADRDRHVVFVGRLVPVKQPDLFIATLAHLRESGFPVTGSVVGTGPEEPALRALASGLDAPVEFVGWKEPWWEAVAADCIVLPSDLEGLGNVLVEAAAAGVPSVALSSALGTADALVPGITGELAVDASPEGLGDAVRKAITYKDSMTPEVIAEWLDRFSVESSVDRLFRVLDTREGTG